MNDNAAAMAAAAATDLRLGESRPQYPHLFDDLLTLVAQRGQYRLRLAPVFQPNRPPPVAAAKVFIV